MRTASDSKRHYMKGYKFWVANQFWETEMYTEKAKQYYRDCLDDMLKRAVKHTSLTV